MDKLEQIIQNLKVTRDAREDFWQRIKARIDMVDDANDAINGALMFLRSHSDDTDYALQVCIVAEYVQRTKLEKPVKHYSGDDRDQT